MQTLPVNPIDLSFLRLHSAVTPQVIASIVRLERLPDISALKSRLADVAEIFPKLKMFIRTSKDTGGHFWESDPEFTVERHLKIYQQSVSDTRTAEEFASAVFATPLPEDRPFWEFSIFCLNERADVPALGMFRFNHAMTDGLGGMEILHAITDDPTRKPPRITESGPETPRVRESAGPLTGMLKKIWNELIRFPIRSAVTGSNSRERCIHLIELDLATLRSFRSLSHASLNDIYLTLVQRTVFRLTEGSKRPSAHRAIVPVSLRSISQRHLCGNYLTGVGLELPQLNETPLESLKRVQSRSGQLREKSVIEGYARLGEFSAKLPARIQKPFVEYLARRTSFICTNVPESARPRYLAGAKILANFGIPALMKGHGLGFCFVSYNGKGCVTVVSDPQIVPNGAEFNRLFHEETEAFAQLLGGKHPLGAKG